MLVCQHCHLQLLPRGGGGLWLPHSGTCINRHLPPGNWCNSLRATVCRKYINIHIQGWKGWMRFVLAASQRTCAPRGEAVGMGGGYMINSAKVKDLRGNKDVRDERSASLCLALLFLCEVLPIKRKSQSDYKLFINCVQVKAACQNALNKFLIWKKPVGQKFYKAFLNFYLRWPACFPLLRF